MEFPDVFEIKETFTREFCDVYGDSDRPPRTIASPYRISPLGAHIDHQGGLVLGMTVSAYTLMTYVPSMDQRILFRSKNYPDTVAFDLNAVPQQIPGAWGYYVRGAALALQEQYTLRHGITGLLNGMLPGCGLSSSSSVLLAYIHAPAEVNDISLSQSIKGIHFL